MQPSESLKGNAENPHRRSRLGLDRRSMRCISVVSWAILGTASLILSRLRSRSTPFFLLFLFPVFPFPHAWSVQLLEDFRFVQGPNSVDMIGGRVSLMKHP